MLVCLARPAGVEPTTPWFVARVKSAIIINELRHGGPRIASVLSATEPDLFTGFSRGDFAGLLRSRAPLLERA